MGTEESVRDGEPTCPECGERVLPSSDKCYNCGAPVDSGEGVSLELWEWGGGLVAMFGIFLTPAVTGLPALYCAYRVYDSKPRSAYAIVGVVFLTVLFWIFLPVFILP